MPTIYRQRRPVVLATEHLMHADSFALIVLVYHRQGDEHVVATFDEDGQQLDAAYCDDIDSARREFHAESRRLFARGYVRCQQ